jgi:hypothetical protein
MPRSRQGTPPPVDVRPARLATPAKGSAGSGLIDVQELVRVQEQREKERASSKDIKVVDPVAEAAIERMNSSGSISLANGSLSPSSGSTPRPPQPELDDEDLDALPNRGRSMIVVMLGVLTLAVGALAYFVLAGG